MSGYWSCKCGKFLELYDNKDNLSHIMNQTWCDKCGDRFTHKTCFRTKFVLLGMIIAVAYGFVGAFYGGVKFVVEGELIYLVLMITGVFCWTIPKLVGETFEKQVDQWEQRGVKI